MYYFDKPPYQEFYARLQPIIDDAVKKYNMSVKLRLRLGTRVSRYLMSAPREEYSAPNAFDIFTKKIDTWAREMTVSSYWK